MVIVDSSVWIDYFNGVDNKATDCLDRHLGVQPVAAPDLVLTEVLQGFKSERDWRTAKKLFASLPVLNTLGRERALVAAHNFRKLRKKGVTIRKTVDTVIASYCISERLPLLYTDRDFEPFVKHLGLRSALD